MFYENYVWLFSAVFHFIGIAVWAGKTGDEFDRVQYTIVFHYFAIGLSWSWGFAILSALLQFGALIPISKSQSRGGLATSQTNSRNELNSSICGEPRNEKPEVTQTETSILKWGPQSPYEEAAAADGKQLENAPDDHMQQNAEAADGLDVQIALGDIHRQEGEDEDEEDKEDDDLQPLIQFGTLN